MKIFVANSKDEVEWDMWNDAPVEWDMWNDAPVEEYVGWQDAARPRLHHEVGFDWNYDEWLERQKAVATDQYLDWVGDDDRLALSWSEAQHDANCPDDRTYNATSEDHLYIVLVVREMKFEEQPKQ